MIGNGVKTYSGSATILDVADVGPSGVNEWQNGRSDRETDGPQSGKKGKKVLLFTNARP